MDDVKHTPGPWQVSGVRYKWRLAHKDQVLDGHAVGPDSDPVTVVFYGGDSQHAEQLANARLIAAAPEMFEALHRITQAFDITGDNFEEVEVDGEMVDPSDVLDAARAALAKAVGK